MTFRILLSLQPDLPLHSAHFLPTTLLETHEAWYPTLAKQPCSSWVYQNSVEKSQHHSWMWRARHSSTHNLKFGTKLFCFCFLKSSDQEQLRGTVEVAISKVCVRMETAVLQKVSFPLHRSELGWLTYSPTYSWLSQPQYYWNLGP